jgi:hypothetical protein
MTYAGCAGSPRLTHLSLQNGKCREISPNCREIADFTLKKASASQRVG